ncbi:MAG: aminotransferase class I/II-fold pyridoxal phosphate-dependent enzyme [Bacteroidetes bacterium]|nr:aminotransferase class I/II-fold pyridoxal phosphate-dependent enzyme [Bacteroidota bacterium]
MIDLRSDTLTRPSPAMLDAMMQAKVGDDVFGEDESINTLQQYAADMFGMEAALFCPSGTMTNQIAIKLHTQAAEEIICHDLSHVYLYEGGGIAFNSGCSVRLITGNNGRFTANDVEENINKEDIHFPRTRLVCIENTMNKGGGACWDLDELKKIKQVCTDNNLALHLDGARLFNALVAKNQDPRLYGTIFNTISICLSKGLGAPVGSLLLGSKEHIYKAKRIRKVFGGGMRQAGFLAAAGLYALQNNIERLAIDNNRAAKIAEVLSKKTFIDHILRAETNIVIFKVKDEYLIENFLLALHQNNIKAVHVGKNKVRFVMHLDITQKDFDSILQVIETMELKQV